MNLSAAAPLTPALITSTLMKTSRTLTSDADYFTPGNFPSRQVATDLLNAASTMETMANAITSFAHDNSRDAAVAALRDASKGAADLSGDIIGIVGPERPLSTRKADVLSWANAAAEAAASLNRKSAI